MMQGKQNLLTALDRSGPTVDDGLPKKLTRVWSRDRDTPQVEKPASVIEGARFGDQVGNESELRDHGSPQNEGVEV
jgi:hypothetical protein